MKFALLLLIVSTPALALDLKLYPEDIARLTLCSDHFRAPQTQMTATEIEDLFKKVNDWDESALSEPQKKWLLKRIKVFKDAKSDPRKLFSEGEIDDIIKYLEEGDLLNSSHFQRWLTLDLIGVGPEALRPIRNLTTPAELHDFLTLGIDGNRKFIASFSADKTLISYSLGGVGKPIILVNPNGPQATKALDQFLDVKRSVTNAIDGNSLFYSQAAKVEYVKYIDNTNEINTIFNDWGFKTETYLSGGTIFKTPDGTKIAVKMPSIGSNVIVFDDTFKKALADALERKVDFIDPQIMPVLQKRSVPDDNNMWLSYGDLNYAKRELESLGWKIKMNEATKTYSVSNPFFKNASWSDLQIIQNPNHSIAYRPEDLREILHQLRARIGE